ncbi:MAG: hypothetical protein E7166_01775 [Firmicutes bacterium]|nr:hypothetical protein [Bacillota bacterium]
MKSRMEKYYNQNEEFIGRRTKNENLYRKKDYSMYSSNETIIDTNNEIDITKLKNIIQSREDYQRAKSYRNMLSDKKFDYDDIEVEEDSYEEKNYDINVLLQKVKDEKDQIDEQDKMRKLRNTQYDILSNLDIKSKKTKTVDDLEKQKEELKDLINSITNKNNSVEVEDNDPLGLLSDLQATSVITPSATINNNDIVPPQKDVEVSNPKSIENKEDAEDEESFYSDSFTFSKKDFEGLTDLNENVKSNNILIKILIIILILIILGVGLLVLNYFYPFIPFL